MPRYINANIYLDEINFYSDKRLNFDSGKYYFEIEMF